eukprot:800897-Pleurochrysis_carterae.AAC.1
MGKASGRAMGKASGREMGKATGREMDKATGRKMVKASGRAMDWKQRGPRGGGKEEVEDVGSRRCCGVKEGTQRAN